jgi:hypothetical protein
MLSVVMLSVVMLSVGMLSVIMLSVVMLSVVMLSVVMLSVLDSDISTLSLKIFLRVKRSSLFLLICKLQHKRRFTTSRSGPVL